MAIKTILCLLTTRDQCPATLKTARDLAEQHQAHLIGLHVVESLMVYPGIALSAASEMISAFNEMEREEAKAVEEIFTQQIANSGLAHELRMPNRGADPIGERVLESARAADLVVVPQPDEDHGRRLTDVIIRGAGRPVLIVPAGYEGKPPGHAILIGWSATREATRAAFDARTIVAGEADGFVLTVSRGASADTAVSDSARDLARTLNRHGMSTTVIHRAAEGADIADILMQEAFERGADLIVSGAFGHSLAYDFIIGAVTHDLMMKSKLPVLFSK